VHTPPNEKRASLPAGPHFIFVWFARRSAPGSVRAPGSGGGQCPHHEHRLEEESNEPFGVGVEAESIDTLAPLCDVAGKDRDEERRNDRPDQHSMATEDDQRRSEHDLDDSGHHHDEIFVEREPVRHLGSELGALSGEVGDAGTDESRAE